MEDPRPKLKIFVIIVCVGMLALIAISNFSPRRTTTPKNACINNLRLIDGAIQEWALENNRTNATDFPTWADLKKYIARTELPKCPSGGTYKLGSVLDPPTCSYPGHKLQ